MDQQKLTKKKRRQLLTLGTMVLGNKGLIELTKQLRDKYKINLTKKETAPETYRDELERDGIVAKVREDALRHFEKLQTESTDQEAALPRELIAAKDENAKEAWNRIWAVKSEEIRQGIESLLGELSVAEALTKYGLSHFASELFVDEYVEYVITNEFQPFPGQHFGFVTKDFPDMVIAVATPGTIQNEAAREFKKAMREKFPQSVRSWDNVVGAACYALHRMDYSDERIALELFDLDPNRRDYDKQLKQQIQNVRKKRERVKKQKDKRM